MASGTSNFLANAWLNTIKGTGTSFNVAGAVYAQLHTGEPGTAGQTFRSSTTTRVTTTFTSATTGVLTTTGGAVTWANWAGTNGEVLSHISFWDTITGSAGNFLWSSSLSAAKTVNTGDTFTLTAATLTITTAS